MENRIAELEQKMMYLSEQLSAHQTVLALLLRPAITGSIKSDVQACIELLSATQEPEKVKLKAHLQNLLNIVEGLRDQVEQSPE